MKRINVYISGETAHGHDTFRPRGDAAAVSVLEGTGQRVFAAYHKEMNSLAALITAAALGLEALREPCSVRVVTPSRLLHDTMTGRMRQVGYWDSWSRLNRAAERHRVQWVVEADEYEQTVLRIARDTARRVAAGARVENELLTEAAARVGEARERHGREPTPDDDTPVPPPAQPARPPERGSLIAVLLTPDPEGDRARASFDLALPKPYQLGPTRARKKNRLLAALSERPLGERLRSMIVGLSRPPSVRRPKSTQP